MIEESKAVDSHATNKPPSKSHHTSDYEEGQFPTEDNEGTAASAFAVGPDGKLPNGKLAKFRFVAKLPAYCRVNPNLPTSTAN